MRALPEPLHPTATLADLATRFGTATDTALPVIDDHGELRGTVLATEVEAALDDAAHTVTAADLARTVAALHPDQSLEDALTELIRHGPSLPIADPATGQIMAWLTHREILHTAAARPLPPRDPPHRERHLWHISSVTETAPPITNCGAVTDGALPAPAARRGPHVRACGTWTRRGVGRR